MLRWDGGCKACWQTVNEHFGHMVAHPVNALRIDVVRGVVCPGWWMALRAVSLRLRQPQTSDQAVDSSRCDADTNYDCSLKVGAEERGPAQLR